MAKLSQMAQGLFGGAAPGPGGEEQVRPEKPADVPQPDARLLAALGKAFSGGGEKSRSTALLVAMRPYMKPEKQEKLDRAMKIARMVHVAEAVVRQYGGEDHGL